MPLYDFFRNLFGIPHNDRSNDYRNDRPNNFSDQFGNRRWEEPNETDEDYERDMPQGPNFHLFTNPLEIQRYFERQMDEMMRSFEDFFRSDNDSSSYGFENFFLPNKPEFPQIEAPKENLRDYYLKPGYEHRGEEHIQKNLDSDLDGEIDASNFNSIFGNKPNQNQQLTPYQPQQSPQVKFFGRSITSRTVQRPDGSVEIHRTTRDNEGNEETTVTRQVGDKQYTVTTKRTKDGKEEKIEDMINLDEKELSQFLNTWQKPTLPQSPFDRPEDPNSHFPFDKFFK